MKLTLYLMGSNPIDITVPVFSSHMETINELMKQKDRVSNQIDTYGSSSKFKVQT